jgi:hypothetical protein
MWIVQIWLIAVPTGWHLSTQRCRCGLYRFGSQQCLLVGTCQHSGVDVDCADLAHSSAYWLALVNTAVNCRVPHRTEKFLTSWRCVCLSRWSVLRAVTWILLMTSFKPPLRSLLVTCHCLWVLKAGRSTGERGPPSVAMLQLMRSAPRLTVQP